MSEEAATEFDPDEESWEAFRERAKRQGGPWTRCLLCYATIPGTNQFAHALYGDCPGVIRKEIGGGETSKPAEVVEWWLCRQVAARAGIEVERHRRGAGRADEARPTTAPSPLGRLLHALGAPQGRKGDVDALPAWWLDAPERTRLRLARTYVWLRGVDRPERPNHPVQLQEMRPDAYRRDLVRFLVSVVRAPGVRGESWPIYLTSGAAAVLNQPPTFP